MWLNHQYHRNEYEHRGFTVLRIVPDGVATRWGNLIRMAIESGRRGKRIDVKDDRGEVAAGIGGRLYYDLIDGIDCEEIVPGMVDTYLTMPALLSVITGEDVVASPYPRSKVCGKLYPADGGQQGWHFDTNGITVLAYLTTNIDGATEMNPIDGGEEFVHPKAGSLLIMQGRKVWHRAGAAMAAPKIVSPWNFYVNGDTSRPEGLDDEIYGSRPS